MGQIKKIRENFPGIQYTIQVKAYKYFKYVYIICKLGYYTYVTCTVSIHYNIYMMLVYNYVLGCSCNKTLHYCTY